MAHARRRSLAELEQAWTEAYQTYARLFNVEQMESTEATRAQLSYAAEAVAKIWHELAMVPGMPWWITAAVVLAAQEFSGQSAALAKSASEPAVQATAERVQLTNPRRLPSSRPGCGSRNGRGA